MSIYPTKDQVAQRIKEVTHTINAEKSVLQIHEGIADNCRNVISKLGAELQLLHHIEMMNDGKLNHTDPYID